MSQNIQFDEEEQPTVIQRRMSAEELVQAIAALEQRHEGDAQRQAETLPVDEIVRELGLRFSSQELWDEVQARRNRLKPETSSRSRLREWLRKRKKAAALSFAAVFFVSAIAYDMQAQPIEDEFAKYHMEHFTFADVSKDEIVREPTAHGIRLCTLSEVPDGVPAIVNADTVFLDNEYVDQTLTDNYWERLYIGTEDGEPSAWRIVKHNGKLYVRGWVQYDTSPAAASLTGITLYSTPTALGEDHKMLPLTLRATRGLLGNQNNMTGRAPGEGWESIHFDRVRLDKYASEKW